MLWICEIGNYIISIGILVRSYFTLFLLVRLKRATPALDGNHDLIVERLRGKMNTIIWGAAGFTVIQTCSFIMYTSQRSIDYFDADKFIFYTSPETQIIQLTLEFIFCLSLFTTICLA